MKKIYILVLISLFGSACNEDFLEELPAGSLVEETTFTNDNNFRTYSWGFYNTFLAYQSSSTALYGSNITHFNEEYHGDLFSNMRASSNAGASPWIWQRIIVPSQSRLWSTPYSEIRRANVMLDNIDGSELDENGKDHWRSVGLFFRSFAYFKLLRRYGGVPWIETALNDNDNLKIPRDTRDLVAGNILRDLTFAEEHIREDDGKNTINVHVVRALISRFGLFEGTWRKYHGLGGEDTYLQASADASGKLIAGFPNLHDNYDEVFNSESLEGINGILLYKAYEFGVLQHIMTSRMRNSAGNWDLTKKAADMYLYKDGTPVGANPDFVGGNMLERDPYSEFRDRDNRMYYTIVPPFQVNTPGDDKTSVEWSHTGDPAHREYIDLMMGLSDADHKHLPSSNWQGFVVQKTPHFTTFNNGQGFNVTRTGYKLFKYYNELNTGIQNADFSDAPIFRMGEVMVNYAEAMFELEGAISQVVADQTINQLRARGGVAPLIIGAITADPRRDPEVDELLWEIRRERAIELMGERFRFDDLRRWKKMDDYAAKEKLGMYVVRADLGNTVPVQGGGSEGYISWFGVPPAFPDHYYLYPIPSNEVLLGEMEQNPGWIVQ